MFPASASASTEIEAHLARGAAAGHATPKHGAVRFGSADRVWEESCTMGPAPAEREEGRRNEERVSAVVCLVWARGPDTLIMNSHASVEEGKDTNGLWARDRRTRGRMNVVLFFVKLWTILASSIICQLAPA